MSAMIQLLLVISVSIVATVMSVSTLNDAASIITNHLSKRALKNKINGKSETGSYCSDNPSLCCTLSESADGCSVGNMPMDQSTLVYPGGETRCIFTSSTPFTFQVIPGASDKMLIYFQGGGACWDKISTKLEFCSTNAEPDWSYEGVFDRTSELSEYKDYTIVHALYCSGDVWGGSVVRDYNDADGNPVTQTGLANAQSVVDWVQSQQQSGALASTFSKLVVMGCSAGSIGAQLWSTPILNILKWSSAAVVPDSYIGVFPEGTQGPLIKGFGLCSAVWLSDALKSLCNNGKLTLQTMMKEFMPQNPSIPYAYIQSKTDIVQESFYVAIALTMNSTAYITPSLFYDFVNSIMSTYNDENENFLTYLVDGDQHCFTPSQIFFTADTVSNIDNGKSTSDQMMYEWANQFPIASDATVSSMCNGFHDFNDGEVGAINNVDYCSSGVTPKSFTPE